MQLLAYIDDKDLTFRAMADLTGQDHEVTVWRHAKGHRMPSPTLIAAYEEATGGMVRLKDWLALKAETTLTRDAVPAGENAAAAAS